MGRKRRWSVRTIRRLVVATVAAGALALGGAASTAAAQASSGALATPGPSAASPAVSGPVTGGQGVIQLQGTTFPLSTVGYAQSEYFLSGTAASYAPVTPLTSSGTWHVTPATSAPYTTRIVVDRPASPAKFNGTVIVEWLNDTAGIDTAADWIYGHDELVRDGFAWVGVSAQQVGVQALQELDPVRYAGLSHPGDSYSYDIFSQAGQAVWDDSAQLLGGLRPKTVLAEGESQSALRLTTYIDAIQPLVHVYDGFLVHSRFGSGAPLSQSPQASVTDPPVVYFRPDLGVPILDVETETDLFIPASSTLPGVGPYLPAQQADSPSFRLWEVAGTAHADAYESGLGAGDTGNGATDAQAFNSMLSPPDSLGGVISCAGPLNTGEEHYVVDAAEYALNQWVTTGLPPAQAARLQVNATGTGYVTDANGNVKGGIRTPAVQVPVATLSGLGNTGSGAEAALFCSLVGTTIPFSAAKLAALYPSHALFTVQWTAAALSDAAAGFIRPADATQLIAAANASSVGD
jgi:Alpha/beta hydrolase domain